MVSHDVTSGNVKKIGDPCTVCMVCGSTQFQLRYSAVTDTNQDVPGEWDILVCSACGTGVLSPFPDSAEVEGFYRNVFIIRRQAVSQLDGGNSEGSRVST